MRTLIVGNLIMLLIGGVAWAGCPDADGPFSTMAGTLLPGRVSEAWCPPAGAPGQPGNTEDAMSWDAGAGTLGDQWRVYGMQISAAGAVETGSDMDEDGNGWIAYSTDYDNGQFWLSKDHLWGDGINDLTGPLLNYNVQTQITYVMGTPVGATSNVYFTGTFDDCPEYQGCVIQYTIANAILVWRSDSGYPMPADYPGFLCGATDGELFDACCITCMIDCVIPTESGTWGALKTMYR